MEDTVAKQYEAMRKAETEFRQGCAPVPPVPL
jgi:hypothetical protein